MTQLLLIEPDWPAAAHVRAVQTTRIGGVSVGDWSGLNLAEHVEDDIAHVQQNRRLLREQLALPQEPAWLTQVHGCDVVDAGSDSTQADGAFCSAPGQVCVVMTADCLPVLLCDRQGTRVAALHAGWRGLVNGILEAGVQRLGGADELIAWLGPAIGPQAFEVGDEVREAFIAVQPQSEAAFVANRPGHWLADIYALARLRLARAGVSEVYGGGECTFQDAEHYYSYRRDGRTGRMASLIWLES